MNISTTNDQRSLTLAVLTDTIGSRSLRVISTTPLVNGTITGTVLGDVSEALPDLPGTLLLVVSGAALPTSLLTEIAERASDLGYAGIAMKIPSGRRDELRALADAAGVPLVEVAEHVSWRYLEGTIAALLGEQNLAASAMPHPGFEPLFSLVNAVADHFKGSVVVEDLSRNILAYSSLPGQRIDRLRTEGILTRRTPYSPYNDEQYRELLRTEDVIQFAEIGDEVPRIAVAIRAGSVPLGTLWAIDGRTTPGTRLSREETELILNAAETAATHMLDNLRIMESNQKPRESILRRLLHGTDVSGTELAELGLNAERGISLCAFIHPQSTDSAIVLAQLKYTVAKHYQSYRDEAIAVSLGGTVYVLLGTSDFTEVRALAERVLPLIDRAVGEGSRAAITDPIVNSGNVAISRDELDDILRCAATLPEPLVLRFEDVQPQILLNSVSDLLERQPRLKNPYLSKLESRPSASDKEVAKTIEVWCSTFGNVARTAEILGIHHNTVRYRIRRAIEQNGLNLHNSDVMLAVWLQLRSQLPESLRDSGPI